MTAALVLLGAMALSSARPLSLTEAIAVADGNSPAVERAQIQVERARLAALRAQIDRVRASVDAQITELYNKPNLAGPTPPGSPDIVLGLSNLQATVSAPIFSGWAITANVERTAAQERQSAFDVARERQALRESVARTYWGLRRVDVLIAARELSVAQLAESERIVTARIAAGLSPAVDENRARQRRLELQSALADLRANAEEQRARFAASIGLADDDVTLTDPIAPFDEAAPAATDAPEEFALVTSRGTHPAMQLVRAGLDVAAADVKLARSQFYPELALFMQGQVGNNPQLAGVGARSFVVSPNPFVGVVGDIQAGLVLRMNLFDTFRDWHGIEDAQHRERMAQADVRATQLVLDTNVRAAHARINALVARRAALVPIRELARENETILKRSYERGDALLLDLLDASVALANAEAQLADVDAQLTEARVLYRLVTGANEDLP